ncbi:hypothetical protein HOK021_39880 [Streptomyces hygroscopicus]|nr:hypothetical protein HOK021_39880 [Streptomyces hygroscopicus]
MLALAAGLALGRDRCGSVEGLAAVEELAVGRGYGGDAPFGTEPLTESQPQRGEGDRAVEGARSALSAPA